MPPTFWIRTFLGITSLSANTSIIHIAVSSSLTTFPLPLPGRQQWLGYITDMPLANPNLPSPPTGKYPAKAHARKVAEYIQQRHGGSTDGVIYLEGQKTSMVEVCSMFSFLSAFRLCLSWSDLVWSDLVHQEEGGGKEKGEQPWEIIYFRFGREIRSELIRWHRTMIRLHTLGKFTILRSPLPIGLLRRLVLMQIDDKFSGST